METNKFKFTQARIDKIPLTIDTAQEIYWDSSLPCFGLKVGKKKKSYFVQRKKDGKSTSVTVGSASEFTLEIARENAKQILIDIRSGINPHEVARMNKANDITFHELFQRYMNEYSKPQKISWKYDEREINKFLPHWFKRKISTIQKSEIIDLLQKIAKNNGTYQSNRILERISSMFNRAIDKWDWTGINPAQGIKKYPEKTRERFLQPHEISTFFNALEKEENAAVKDYLLMSLLTGARKTNVLEMRWNDLDLEFDRWRIPRTKNGDPLDLPLVQEAKEILNSRKNDMEAKRARAFQEGKKINTEWVFEGDGKKGHLADPAKAWKRIRQLATIEIWKQDQMLSEFIEKIETDIRSENNYKFTSNKLVKKIKEKAKKENINLPIGLLDLRIHDIRRTLGSYQAITGSSISIIGKTLGHKNLKSTEIYARLHIDPVRESMEKATSAILGKRNTVAHDKQH